MTDRRVMQSMAKDYTRVARCGSRTRAHTRPILSARIRAQDSHVRAPGVYHWNRFFPNALYRTVRTQQRKLGLPCALRHVRRFLWWILSYYFSAAGAIFNIGLPTLSQKWNNNANRLKRIGYFCVLAQCTSKMADTQQSLIHKLIAG